MKTGTMIVGNTILAVMIPGILIPVIMNWGAESAAQRDNGIMVCLAASAGLLLLSAVLCWMCYPEQTKRIALRIGIVVLLPSLIAIPWGLREYIRSQRLSNANREGIQRRIQELTELTTQPSQEKRLGKRESRVPRNSAVRDANGRVEAPEAGRRAERRGE